MPIYETEADRRRQRQVADEIERRWCCTLIDRPEHDPVDFDVFRGSVQTALIEVKCLTHDFADLGHPVRIKLRKYDDARALSAELDVPVWLVLRFGDGWIRGLDLSLVSRSTLLAGRRDRDDPNDVGLYVTIPVANTRLLV